MKKLFLIAAAAFLFTGVAFANDGGGKRNVQKVKHVARKMQKEDCKKDSKEKACCNKDAKKTTAKVEPKKA
jgi:hypothetical protein